MNALHGNMEELVTQARSVVPVISEGKTTPGTRIYE